MNPFPLYIIAILFLLDHRTAAAIFAMFVVVISLGANLRKAWRRR